MQIDETTAYSAFGSDVFTDAEMERRLPAEMYRALHRTMEEGTELTFEVAGAVADRDDALGAGARRHAFYALVPADDRRHRREARHISGLWRAGLRADPHPFPPRR